MISRAKEQGTFSGKRRWLARLNVLAAVGLCFYIVAVLNLIFFRHAVRIDLTEEGLYSLSKETRAKLELVREEIRVLLPYYQQPRNPEHRTAVLVLQRARRLLKEYQAVQPLVRLEAEVNIYEQADRWASLREKYGLAESEVNRLIFIAGGGTGSYRQTVTPNELAVFARERDKALAPQVREFRGEQAMTGAIMKLVNRERRKVYFVQGHGEAELDPAASAGGAGMRPGLGPLRHDLESSGFEALEISLLDVSRVPDDCSLLVIPGPERPFSPREVEVLERYLLDDGRVLLALAGQRTGLEELLEKWGIEVVDQRVRARVVLPGEKLERAWVPVGEYNAGHPITAPFRDTSRFEMLLWLPQPVRPIGGQRTLKTERLAGTGPSTDTERFFLVGEDVETLDERSRRGDFTLAVATQPSFSGRPPPGWEERRTRIVVVGASNFLRDADERASVRGGYLSASHRDFFMNCVHWLVGEENLMAAGGRRMSSRALPPLTADLKLFLLLASVVIFPGLFALLGTTVYFLRRA